jgi:putative membrane-bound dehydrogenase-like protein
MKNPTLLILCILILAGCQKEAPEIDFEQLSDSEQRLAENALASMEVAPGLEIELFASEPMISNPTNISVDARGRVWLCEANNYRLPFNLQYEEKPEGDRILILEDTDGDGKADSRKVFYQGSDINAALGIGVFGDKIIVSRSPHIFLFTDANGDDVPDSKDTLFMGIKGIDDDHGIHAVKFGPDGRYYFNAGNGGKQLFYKNGDPVLDKLGRPIVADGNPYRQGMVFRCDPDGSNAEVLGHNFRNIYEVAIDAFGSLWQSDNDDDGNKGARINFVMEYGNYGYTDEITGAGWRERRIGMHEEIPKRHWHLNDPGVVPNLLQTGAGSPCGMSIYEGELLPDVFHNQMIHAEALHNVVRSYPVQTSGAGYSAEIVDIMKSKDKWSRPSDVAIAPDGSLFVSDWYDPGVGGNKMDDITRGRIYRLAPNVKQYQIPAIDLSSAEGAVTALTNPNMDIFYQAWNYLHQAGENAEAALVNLWQSDNPRHRARALWLLARIDGKSEVYINQALEDDNPDIRITGLRIARQLGGKAIETYIEKIVADAAPSVRREAAIALRFSDSQQAAILWAQLAQQYDGTDRWYLEALGIGSDLNAQLFFNTWQEKFADQTPEAARENIIWRMRSGNTAPLLVEMIKNPEISDSELQKYLRAFHFIPDGSKDSYLSQLLNLDHPLKASINTYVLGLLSGDYLKQSPQIKTIANEVLPGIAGTAQWLTIIESLQLKEQIPALMELLLSKEESEIKGEAAALLFEFGGAKEVEKHLDQLDEAGTIELVNQLRYVGHPKVAQLLDNLLEETNSYPMKATLVNAMGDNWDAQPLLFERVKSGNLQGDLKNAAVLKLMNCWHYDIRKAAPEYLVSTKGKAGFLPSPKVLATKEGFAEKGKQVFETHCQTCHQINGAGTEFGPDLSKIGDKLAKESIYSAILYPSAGINFGYEGFLVKLKNEQLLSGYIASETEEALTLRMNGGINQTVNKSDIASKEAMDQSLMTANLQALMEQKDLINLVEYLSQLQ